MSNRAKAVILTISFAVVLFTVVGGLGVKAATNNDGAYRQLGVYSEVLSRIRTEYVEDPNIPLVTDGALHGLLESLDANSSYLDPTQYKSYKQHKAEAKGSIGADVSKRFGYAAVISVIPGSPADKAGLDAGDIIESLEGKTTRELSLAEVQNVLTGPVGSSVTMSIVRARRAQPTKVTITREEVKIPAAQEKVLEEGIGYIKVDALTKGKAQEIASKIKAVQKSGAKKLILDLREVAAGEESEGIATANLFLNRGTIAYLQGQKYPKETYNADPSKATTDLPLLVLVNRGTAGPAEIVAAAILENNRGDVLGDKTFGVGSVQRVIDLPSGGALILSVAKYYTPTGKAIQDTAITPNILVADATDDFLPEDDSTPDGDENEPLKKPERKGDEQLRRAIEVMKNSGQRASL